MLNPSFKITVAKLYHSRPGTITNLSHSQPVQRLEQVDYYVYNGTNFVILEYYFITHWYPRPVAAPSVFSELETLPNTFPIT